MRRKIGLLVPSGNTTFEPDFVTAIPKNITVHSTRIYSNSTRGVENQKNIDEINDNIEEFTSIISHARPEIIAYGFTTGSFYRGIDYAKLLEKRIMNISGKSAVLPALAILEALAFIKASRISVITPYLSWNNKVLEKFFNCTKYHVQNIKGDERSEEIAIKDRMTDQEPNEITDYILKKYDKKADTIVLPCTAWRTFEVVETIEKETNLNVITANQATIWSVFKEMRISPNAVTGGRLFKSTDISEWEL